MFVTLRIILKNISKGVILSFLIFYSFIVFSNPVHGSEAAGEKAEFHFFPTFMEYFVKCARISNELKRKCRKRWLRFQKAYENNLLINHREEK